MKTTRIICFVLVLSLLCTTLTCCAGSKSAVEQRVQEFVSMCNQFDVDGVLRCIDPSIAQYIAIILASGSLVNIDKYQIFSWLYELIIGNDSLSIADFFSSIQVDIQKTKVSGKRASVYAYISYAIADIKFTKEGIIGLEKQAGIWYIESLEFTQFD